jgi:hypothetical protein
MATHPTTKADRVKGKDINGKTTAIPANGLVVLYAYIIGAIS